MLCEEKLNLILLDYNAKTKMGWGYPKSPGLHSRSAHIEHNIQCFMRSTDNPQGGQKSVAVYHYLATKSNYRTFRQRRVFYMYCVS